MIDEHVVGTLRGEFAEMGLGDRFASLVGSYVEHTGDRVAELRTAIGQEDLAAVARLAHLIRGGSATMGATGIAEVCAALEDAAHAGDQDAAERLVARAGSILRPTGDALLHHC